MSYLFACDHCGKKFELETLQAKECPYCFWTSSVKREDELSARDKRVSPVTRSAVSGGFGKILFDGLKKLLRVLFFIVVFVAVGFLGYKGYRLFVASRSPQSQVLAIHPGSQGKAASKLSDVSGLASLSPQEKEALYREVKVPEDRIPDAGELSILGKAVPLQTGWIEKLPSPPWTLDQYQKMIAEKEAFYKMPFARSYKKKLEDLFKSKYLAAVDSFTKGDVLMARDLWVASLAFPLYSKDLKIHRAVALTMLRPFINDTLSKVSAMNQSLLDRAKKTREQALSGAYQNIHAEIAQKKWGTAIAGIDALIQEVDALRKDTKPPEAPPQYPEAFGTIDADLQRPLMDLMAPSPSSTLDLQPLQQDLVEKRELMETFTEAYLKAAMALYQTGLAALHEEKWTEAAQAFGAIQGPPMLQQDAMQKMAILVKLQPPNVPQTDTDPGENIS